VGAEPAGVLVVVVSTVDIDPSTGRSGLAVTPTDGVATGVGKIGGGDTTRLGVGGSGITIKTAPIDAKRCRPVVDAAGVAISNHSPGSKPWHYFARRRATISMGGAPGPDSQSCSRYT
jgi:hypothetical protein